MHEQPLYENKMLTPEWFDKRAPDRRIQFSAPVPGDTRLGAPSPTYERAWDPARSGGMSRTEWAKIGASLAAARAMTARWQERDERKRRVAREATGAVWSPPPTDPYTARRDAVEWLGEGQVLELELGAGAVTPQRRALVARALGEIRSRLPGLPADLTVRYLKRADARDLSFYLTWVVPADDAEHRGRFYPLHPRDVWVRAGQTDVATIETVAHECHHAARCRRGEQIDEASAEAFTEEVARAFVAATPAYAR